MESATPIHGRRISSTLGADGRLTIALVEAPVRQPGADDVVIKVEAAPINPSDLMSLLASCDPAAVAADGSADAPCVQAQLSPEQTTRQAGRHGLALPSGLEGAGTVIAAGENARHLIGKAVAGLSMDQGFFAEYVTMPAAACVPLPDGLTTREGAALFVNPLTALAIAETARLDGHTALIHTAAASNLGQMLVKICRDEGLALVNVVRRPAQAELLRELGATHVCDSSQPDFTDALVAALKETGATIAFDAIGGGTMAGQLLATMERAAISRMTAYSPYGSAEAKRVWVYGYLDQSPIVLASEAYGMFWGVEGWAMPAILERAGPERAMELQMRVLREIKTTFASHFTREISLAEALDPEVMAAYARQATGEKYLINPTL